MLNELKIINNFINKSQCQIISDSVDNCDLVYLDSNSESRKSSLNDPNPELVKLVKNILNKIKLICNNDKLYIAEYMVTLSYPGMSMIIHDDTEDREHFTVSAVLYANNDFDGGDIIFPNIPLTHSPKMGDVAIFPSGGDNFVHGVKTITSGKRYAMPIWITDQVDKALFI